MGLEERVIRNIKKYRKLRHISQEQLAELCNTSTSYIGLLEIGRNVPKLDTIERIARALEVEPELLFLTDDDNTISKNVDITRKKIAEEVRRVLEKHLI